MTLFAQNVFLRDSLVSYLLGHYFRVKWVDVFVFWGQVHRSYSHTVHVLICKRLAFDQFHFAQVLIKYLCRKKIGPGGALERSADFDHPVHHFGAVFLADFVAFDWTPIDLDCRGRVVPALSFGCTLKQLLLHEGGVDALEFAVVHTPTFYFGLQTRSETLQSTSPHIWPFGWNHFYFYRRTPAHVFVLVVASALTYKSWIGKSRRIEAAIWSLSQTLDCPGHKWTVYTQRMADVFEILLVMAVGGLS